MTKDCVTEKQNLSQNFNCEWDIISETEPWLSMYPSDKKMELCQLIVA